MKWFGLIWLLQEKTHFFFSQETNGVGLPLQFGKPKSPQSANGIQVAEGVSNSRSGGSGFGLFGIAGPLFTRTQSLSSAVLQQVRSTTSQKSWESIFCAPRAEKDIYRSIVWYY